jgi:MFS transporter, ACS family, hexuronate transporter
VTGGQAKARIGNYRWWICALLFFATTINYVDRQVIALLKDNIGVALGWTKENKEVLYAYIVASFQAAYALGYLFGGRISDVIGLRKGYTLAVALWSFFALVTGFVTSTVMLGIARAGLGLAEGGNFPSAIKTVSEWFPKKERALATGIFNAGSNVGPILTPLIVPPLALNYGWPAAFYITGAIGSLWIIAWLLVYKRPEDEPKLSPAELAHIRSDDPEETERLPWSSLLKMRGAWAFIVGMMLSSPIWWFYLFWAPDFFSKNFGLDLKNIGPPLIAIYLVADIGSVGGGWFSSHLIKRGWHATDSRKLTLLICALCVAPIYFAAQVSNQWIAVGLFGLAMAGHQGWSANLYTIASDTVPRSSVSSVIGMGGMAGSTLSLFFSLYVGNVLKKTGNYQVLLTIAPLAYLVAFVNMHMLIPTVRGRRPA